MEGRAERRVAGRAERRVARRAERPVALVTGGSRGIGLASAEALARDGWDLAICGVRSEGEVEPALERLRAAGVEVLYARADIAQEETAERLLSAIRQRFGRLDCLVNNAGVGPLERRDILEASRESFDRVLRINLRGPWFLTQAAARFMMERRPAPQGQALPRQGSPQGSQTRLGCIVFITSISAETASVDRGEYCVSKAGLAMAARLWAARLAGEGIAVYEVRPGIIRTDMTAGVAAKYDRLIGEGLTLERRWGTPEDVGRAVALLARGELTYSPGQVILVDGGMSVPRL